MALLGGLARLATCLLLAWNLPVPAAAAPLPGLPKAPGVSTTEQSARFVLPELVQPPTSDRDRLNRGPPAQKAASPRGCARAAISIAAVQITRSDRRRISAKRLSFEARAPPADA